MNKKEMVETIVQKTWLSSKESDSALQAFLDVVSEQLQNMEEQEEKQSE